MGCRHVLQPLAGLRGESSDGAPVVFTPVSSVADLDRARDRPPGSSRDARLLCGLVCLSKEMERYTFSDRKCASAWPGLPDPGVRDANAAGHQHCSSASGSSARPASFPRPRRPRDRGLRVIGLSAGRALRQSARPGPRSSGRPIVDPPVMAADRVGCAVCGCAGFGYNAWRTVPGEPVQNGEAASRRLHFPTLTASATRGQWRGKVSCDFGRHGARRVGRNPHPRQASGEVSRSHRGSSWWESPSISPQGASLRN